MVSREDLRAEKKGLLDELAKLTRAAANAAAGHIAIFGAAF
jgi:hypothetical protein